MPLREIPKPEVPTSTGDQASNLSDALRNLGNYREGDSGDRRPERLHSSSSEQKPEIGYDRFLPEKLEALRREGRQVAPVLNHEINTALHLGTYEAEKMDANELRSVFSLVQHWLEQTKNSQLITDTERKTLRKQAEEVEQGYNAYKKANYAEKGPSLKALRKTTSNYLYACTSYRAKDLNGKCYWSYVENVGPDKPITYLPFEALVHTELTMENYMKARMQAEQTPEKLDEALGLTEQTIRGLKEKLTDYANKNKLKIYEDKSNGRGGFYIYDPTAVKEKVLQKHRSVLTGVSELKNPSPDMFVKWISKAPISENTTLFNMKCDAFGEFSNRDRTDVYNPLRDGDAKEQRSVTINSLYAEKVELAYHKRIQAISKERELLPQSKRLIGYDRFLPKVQEKGVEIAPVQKSEIQSVLWLRQDVGMLTVEEL